MGTGGIGLEGVEVICQRHGQPVGDNAEGIGRGGKSAWSLRESVGGIVFLSHSRVPWHVGKDGEQLRDLDTPLSPLAALCSHLEQQPLCGVGRTQGTVSQHSHTGDFDCDRCLPRPSPKHHQEGLPAGHRQGALSWGRSHPLGATKDE